MAARILRSKALIAAATEADFWHGARMAVDALAPRFGQAASFSAGATGSPLIAGMRARFADDYAAPTNSAAIARTDPVSEALVVTIAPGKGAFALSGSEILVNSATASNQQNSTITHLSGGGFVVTWDDDSLGVGGATGDTSDFAVKAQFFSAAGAKVGSEILVNSAVVKGQLGAKVAELANGNILMTWEDNSAGVGGAGGDTSSSAIKAQLFTAGGARIGGEFLVNTTTQDTQLVGQVAALSNNGFVISWYDGFNGAAGPGLIRAQAFAANGAKVGSEVLVNTTIPQWGVYSEQIGALPGGGFVVTWQSSQSRIEGGGEIGSPIEIRAQVFAANGAKVGSEILVNTATAKTQTDPHLAMLANGGFAITWKDDSQGVGGATGDGNLGAIKAQVFDSAGTKIGGEILVNTSVLGDQTSSKIVALSGGGFALCWATGTSGLYVQVFDSQGAKVGAEIHTTTGWNAFDSRMAALANGEFVVTGEAFDSSGKAIGAQVFDAFGNKVGSEFLVNTATAGDQNNPAVTALAGGGFALSWTDASAGVGGAAGDNSGTAIKAQVFQDIGAYVATEQVALSLKGGLSASDAGAGSSVVTAIVAVDYGILHLTAGTSGAAISNNDSGAVTITGTLAQINALLGSDPTSAITYTANTDTPPGTAMLTFSVDEGGGGSSASTSATIVIAAADDFPVAVPDSYSTNENVVLHIAAAGALINDTDVDGGPKTIFSLNGNPLSIGPAVTLASGAKLSLGSDGSLSYDPNGAFNYLVSQATATATGAVDGAAVDSFTYTLNGGSSTTVYITVNGVDGAGDHLNGNAGDNTITGTASANYFDLSQGGNDVANGLGSDDGFFFGAAFTGADQVDGGAGTNDQIGLQGDYTGPNALVMGPSTIANIETIVVLPGFSYDITMNDGNVAAGGLLKVQATQLAAGQSLHFDGSAETNGSFAIYGGNGNDNFTGGGGNDGFYFGPGQFNGSDLVNGGGGSNDQLALDGNYTITLGGNITNVEVLVLLHGPTKTPNLFNITASDAFVPAGQTITIFGLQVETGINFNGSGEHDGAFKFYGGLSGDTLTGGDGNDWLFGSLAGDTLTGGAGRDTFFYDNVTQSTSLLYDRIVGFDESADMIDLPFAVSGFAAPASGSLGTANFDSDLSAALGGLGSHQAVMFTATGGNLAGHTFLVVDANGTPGYQGGNDYVFEMVNPVTPVDNPAIFV